MYITKRPEIARIAEDAGVDWIFVDMEFIGNEVQLIRQLTDTSFCIKALKNVFLLQKTSLF